MTTFSGAIVAPLDTRKDASADANADDDDGHRLGQALIALLSLRGRVIIIHSLPFVCSDGPSGVSTRGYISMTDCVGMVFSI